MPNSVGGRRADIGPGRWLGALAFVSAAHVLAVGWLAGRQPVSVPPGAALVMEVALVAPAPAPVAAASGGDSASAGLPELAPPEDDAPAVVEPEPEVPAEPEPEARPEPAEMVEPAPPPPDPKPEVAPPPPPPEPRLKPAPKRPAKAKAAQTPADVSRGRRDQGIGASAGTASGPATAAAATGPRYDAAYLRNPAPPYPPAARRRSLQGRVLVHAVVGPGGDCARAEVRKSSGHPILDEAALQAVRGWRFVPATRDGRPVAAGVEIPIVFRLEG